MRYFSNMNRRGFSVVSVLAGLGIFSVVIAGVLAAVQFAVDSQRYADDRQVTGYMWDSIRDLLKNQNNCASTLSAAGVVYTVADGSQLPLNLTSLRNASGSDVYNSGAVYENGRLELRTILIDRYVPSDTTAPGAYEGSADMILTFVRTRAGVGPQEFSRVVKLNLRLDSTPGSNEGRPIACAVSSMGSETFWEASPSVPGGVFYSAGRVGVGTNAPTFPLHVQTDVGTDANTFYPMAAFQGGADATLRFLEVGYLIDHASSRNTYLQTYNSGGPGGVLSLQSQGGNIAVGGLVAYGVNNKIHLEGANENVWFNIVNTATDDANGRFPGITVKNFMGAMSAGYPMIRLESARGQYGAPSSTQSGDILSMIITNGQAGFNGAQAARIEVIAEQNFTATDHGSSMVFSTVNLGSNSNSEKLRISANGNIGIGTPSPGYKLDVQGGDINASGSIRSAGLALTSDLRYKRDIRPLDNALEKILSLRGVAYHWRADEFPQRHFNDRPQMGVIAQDVERQFPEVVESNHEGYKSVNYAALVAPLIEAIKTLYTREISAVKVETVALRAENALLKAKIDVLEVKLKRLERETQTRFDKLQKLLNAK